MVFKQETDKKRIMEFLDLVENDKVELRNYKKPVLVWAVDDDTVYYSFWEQELLDKFGIDNVDGYDYRENLGFCPDWVSDDDDWDDEGDEEDDIDPFR